LFRETFDDVALLIGAAATVHRLDDAAVWMLLRRLERVRSRALARLLPVADRSGCESSLGLPACSHPAVEQFLRRSRANCSTGRVTRARGSKDQGS
jgi:hypothetical protein